MYEGTYVFVFCSKISVGVYTYSFKYKFERSHKNMFIVHTCIFFFGGLTIELTVRANVELIFCAFGKQNPAINNFCFTRDGRLCVCCGFIRHQNMKEMYYCMCGWHGLGVHTVKLDNLSWLIQKISNGFERRIYANRSEFAAHG